jgi:hypothetical protein
MSAFALRWGGGTARTEFASGIGTIKVINILIKSSRVPGSVFRTGAERTPRNRTRPHMIGPG